MNKIYNKILNKSIIIKTLNLIWVIKSVVEVHVITDKVCFRGIRDSKSDRILVYKNWKTIRRKSWARI